MYIHQETVNIFKIQGNPALDSKLYNLETGEWVNLLSYAKPNRALVLNFGSCSWPPFMSQLENFGKLRERFSAGVDFVTIYISEAHPTEQVITRCLTSLIILLLIWSIAPEKLWVSSREGVETNFTNPKNFINTLIVDI